MTEQELKEIRKFMRESKKRIKANNERFQQAMTHIDEIHKEIWNAL